MISDLFQKEVEANAAPGPHYEAETPGLAAPTQPRVRLIAFYLPQFHPIPENDAWWGRGFTEWSNVAKATPSFAGHIQPRLPADLGFYDLRNPETLRLQIELARRYGIGGFCFHHYWFNGRRLLHRPLDLFLADPTLDMPFCINWANENWTRRWDGLDDEVLIAQHHSPDDDVAFARSLIPIVRDSRYIRIGGRPLIMVYRPGVLPEPVATMRRWRTEFARAGIENPYIVMAQGFGDHDPRHHGMDAAAEFPPHKVAATPQINDRLRLFDPEFAGAVQDYREVARHAVSLPSPEYKLFHCVAPAWDNTARKPGRGFVLTHSTPAAYGAWLNAACRTALGEADNPDERIVFVNAWNEWAEGAYLEPDRHFGHAYLAETARTLLALESGSANQPMPDSTPRLALVSHDAHLHGAQLIALAIARTLVIDHGVRLTVLLGGPGELEREFEAIAPAEVVPGNFEDLLAWRKIAHRLAGSGVTAVLCNSLVSAKAIGPFRDAGLRVVQLVHELPSLIRQYGLQTAATAAAAHAAAVVFPSAYIRDRFVALTGPIRGRAILRHQGLYMSRLGEDERRQRRADARRALAIDPAAPVVLGAGYGDLRKGVDLWPRLAGHVLAACPDAILLWVGRVEPALRQWLDHDLEVAGLTGRVLFPGPASDMAAIYAAADVYALTSREDPFPSVVIEAMASGLPTVVFEECGGIVDLVRDAGGLAVPYLDVEAMAREVTRLLLNPQAARAMGAALARRITRDFDYADYGAALLALALPATPTVSVVVPNFNYARHLRQRVESIWAQQVAIEEIVILDDASTDDSDFVIRQLEIESAVSVRVVRNDVNSGSVARQWARGVSMARSELVWIAEADDFAEPGFLAAVLPAFEDPDVVLSYSESRMVDEDGAILAPDYRGYVADIDPIRWTGDFRANGPDEVARALAVKNTIPNASAAVFRREPLAAVLAKHMEELGRFRNVADWLCYIRLLAHGSVAFTARPLNNHRRHARSVTLASTGRQHLDEIAAMQDAAASVAPVGPGTRAVALQYRRSVAEQFGIAS